MANKTEYLKGVYGYGVPESGVSVEITSSKNKNAFGNEPSYSTGMEENKPAENRAETALSELRNRYAQQLRQQFDYAADRIKDEKEEALRENWVLMQQEEAGIAERLAAEGTNGGAAETALSGIRAKYQDERNDIRKGFADDLGELSFDFGKKQAEAARSYDEKWLEYLISLAENEDEFEKDLELKIFD
ncbi:MAG: hypothetical protein IJE83_04330 [Oscillospiraceae bacterium]|nr:hypothetical protein [Oscillospiraceae bacterium]